MILNIVRHSQKYVSYCREG